jgi:hypothetical protein
MATITASTPTDRGVCREALGGIVKITEDEVRACLAN